MAATFSNQRMPAWKRLGLKLKGAGSDYPTSNITIDATKAQDHAQDEPAAVRNRSHAAEARKHPIRDIIDPAKNKRKLTSADVDAVSKKRSRLQDEAPAVLPNGTSTDPNGDLKRSRDSGTLQVHDDNKSDKRKKSEERKREKGAEKKEKSKQRKRERQEAKRQEKEARKDATKNGSKDIGESLRYLRQWDTDRTAWKFNKNHQTLLMKYCFRGQSLPSTDIETFYKYIRDVKGFSRTRLREAAQEVKTSDAKHSDQIEKDEKTDAKAKQAEYEAATKFLVAPSEQKAELRRFDEVKFAETTIDEGVKARVIRRIRVEKVLDELSESDESSPGIEATAVAALESGRAGESVAETSKDARLARNGTRKRVRPGKRRNLSALADDLSESSSESSSSESESEADDEADVNTLKG